MKTFYIVHQGPQFNSSPCSAGTATFGSNETPLDIRGCVLYCCNPVALFTSWAAADRAIKRTVKYRNSFRNADDLETRSNFSIHRAEVVQ